MLLVKLDNGLAYTFFRDEEIHPDIFPHVVSVTADSNELAHIRWLYSCINNHTYTIPMPAHSTVTWFGDVAKTIVANWYM